jgi:hypothetical protein
MLGSLRKELSVSLLATAALALPAAAHAVDLTTSPLYANGSESYHACNVANVSTTTANISIEIVSSSGTVIVGPRNVPINPSNIAEVSTPENYTGFAYCLFNIGNEAKANFRANLTVFHYTGSFYDSLALSEAR